MKAAIIKDYSNPIEITEVSRPRLKGDSVLIKVHCASLNPIDDIIRSGEMKDMLPLNFPHIMGYDVSGEVIEVGEDVHAFKIGQAVFARASQEDAGAIAQVARVKETDLALKPANLSHAEAASVPLAGLTAWQALITKGKLEKGDKVLIHAGSGGVGTLAIQIAKHRGAYVATTCSAKNADLVKKLGADLVIDYRTQSFNEELADYDLVFDMLGGETLNRSFKVLKKGGAMVLIKGQDSDKLAPEHDVRFEFLFMEPNGQRLAELGHPLERGLVTTVVGERFPMARTADAYRALSNGQVTGKIVVDNL